MKTYKAANEQARAKGKSLGMNWIRQEKRLAIYLRDGLACCYCGSSVTEGAQLTLDHIHPYSLGGSNKETNLVTCCGKCNSSRGNRDYVAFADATAGYLNHGLKGSDIVAHIQDCVTRSLDVNYAKEIIARQGSCFNALKSL